MMTITVDGVNIGTTYGVMITKGGLNSLLSFPPPKDISITDWNENDGEDPDLENIRLSANGVSINFDVVGTVSQVQSFYSYIGGATSRTWAFSGIGLTLPLRVKGISSYDYAISIHSLTVTLSHDDHWNVIIPISGVATNLNTVQARASLSRSSSLAQDASYSLDGTYLSSYGIRVLKGTMRSLIPYGEYKNPIELDVCSRDGILTDPVPAGVSYTNPRHIGGRSMTLQCLMTAPTSQALLNNHYSLLRDLIIQNAQEQDLTRKCRRTLVTPAGTLYCWYKGHSVTEFFPDSDKMWMKFSLSLAIL